jgi:catalase
VLLGEMFRHYKVIGGWGDGDQVLTAAGIDTTAPGVILAEMVAKPYTIELFGAVGLHRAWDRSS